MILLLDLCDFAKMIVISWEPGIHVDKCLTCRKPENDRGNCIAVQDPRQLGSESLLPKIITNLQFKGPYNYHQPTQVQLIKGFHPPSDFVYPPWNSHSSRKWWLGDEFPFGFQPIFRGELLNFRSVFLDLFFFLVILYSLPQRIIVKSSFW